MTRIITVGILLVVALWVGTEVMHGATEVMENLVSTRNAMMP